MGLLQITFTRIAWFYCSANFEIYVNKSDYEVRGTI